MSVKKYAPYRQDKGDRYRWNKKDQEKLHELKSTIKNRSGGAFGSWTTTEGQTLTDHVEKAKKRKGKKERMKAKVALGEHEETSADDQTILANNSDARSTKKRKREGDKGIVQTGTGGPQKKKRTHQENVQA